jgi:hypothetical protein
MLGLRPTLTRLNVRLTKLPILIRDPWFGRQMVKRGLYVLDKQLLHGLLDGVDNRLTNFKNYEIAQQIFGSVRWLFDSLPEERVEPSDLVAAIHQAKGLDVYIVVKLLIFFGGDVSNPES